MSGRAKTDGDGSERPGRTPATEAAKRLRDARLAAELRANLPRRKADLARRGAAHRSGDEETG
jgi:hypothetical protein